MSEAKRGKYIGVNSPSYGRKHSEESKRRMSEKKLGRKLSEETKRKVSLNNARYMLGKHPSTETLKKLSESHKGIKPSKETLAKRAMSMKGKNSKSVLLYTKDGEFVAKFVSTVACAEFLKTSSSNISAAIRDNRLICKKKYKVVYANT